MNTKPAPARRGLLAGGNWIVDHVKVIDVFPRPESLANIQTQTTGSGGAPYNVLLNLARLGAPFPLLAAGLVGKDDAGLRVINDCRKQGIDTKHLDQTPKAPTSFTDVMTETGSGRRTFFHLRGANALWDGGDLNFAKIKARHFHLGYLLLLDSLDAPDVKFGTKAARLLAAAQAAGLKTSVDVVSEESDRFSKIVSPALKFVDCCIVNEFEAGRTTGFKIRQADGRLDTVSLRHAAGAMLQLGVRDLVVIHFPEGAFARTRRGEDVWQSSLKLPPKAIVGAVGAGDAFASGVLLGLHEGWELSRCLLTGVCTAAASLGQATSTTGVGSLNSTLALAKKYGFRPKLVPNE